MTYEKKTMYFRRFPREPSIDLRVLLVFFDRTLYYIIWKTIRKKRNINEI